MTGKGDWVSESFRGWNGPKWSKTSSKFKSWRSWLEAKAIDDGAEGLWRVHDGLYDLNDFIKSHPGGEMWLRLSKGTDVTEAFEAHHIDDKAHKMLTKFYVRDAAVPRNSPLTFDRKGFYCVLRERARAAFGGNVPKGPSFWSKAITDTLIVSGMLLSVLAVTSKSLPLAAASTLILTAGLIATHNFIHMKDNFRMYYMHLGGFSVRTWRVVHVLSHHLYPNSRQDLEISLNEPIFQWYPKPGKSWAARYLPRIYFPFVAALVYHYEAFNRLLFDPDGWCELLPLTMPACMMILGQVNVTDALIWWTGIEMASSAVFTLIGYNAAHHHPDIFHDGDEPRSEKMDWGEYQLFTVRDRVEVVGFLPLVLTLFGDHSLHHMFPTVDHYHLPKLYPALRKTCAEFNVDFQLMTIWELIKGQYRQLARTTPKKQK